MTDLIYYYAVPSRGMVKHFIFSGQQTPEVSSAHGRKESRKNLRIAIPACPVSYSMADIISNSLSSFWRQPN
jgi:hypothetical protein